MDEQEYPETCGKASSDDLLQLRNLFNGTTETTSVVIFFVTEGSAMTEFADD
jgi:hypothetical protein